VWPWVWFSDEMVEFGLAWVLHNRVKGAGVQCEITAEICDFMVTALESRTGVIVLRNVLR